MFTEGIKTVVPAVAKAKVRFLTHARVDSIPSPAQVIHQTRASGEQTARVAADAHAVKHASSASELTSRAPPTFDEFVEFLFRGTTSFADYDSPERLAQASTSNSQHLVSKVMQPGQADQIVGSDTRSSKRVIVADPEALKSQASSRGDKRNLMPISATRPPPPLRPVMIPRRYRQRPAPDAVEEETLSLVRRIIDACRKGSQLTVLLNSLGQRARKLANHRRQNPVLGSKANSR